MGFNSGFKGLKVSIQFQWSQFNSVFLKKPPSKIFLNTAFELNASQKNLHRGVPLHVAFGLLTPWSRVCLEKLMNSLASQEMPTIYGTWWLIDMFTHIPETSSLSSERYIKKATPSHPIWDPFSIIHLIMPWSCKSSFSFRTPTKGMYAYWITRRKKK